MAKMKHLLILLVLMTLEGHCVDCVSMYTQGWKTTHVITAEIKGLDGMCESSFGCNTFIKMYKDGKEVGKTETAFNASNPIFEKKIHVDDIDLKEMPYTLEVYNEDTETGEDKSLGAIPLRRSDLFSNRRSKKTEYVLKPEGVDEDVFVEVSSTMAVTLRVTLSNIPNYDKVNRKADLYLVAKIKEGPDGVYKKIYQTPVVDNVVNTTLDVIVANYQRGHDQILLIQAYDYDHIGKDDFIGQFEVHMDTYISPFFTTIGKRSHH